MQSYKEANEKIGMSGNGLKGIQYTSFHEYIVRNVCKYYYELDPILKNRPNVRPWATNEDDDLHLNSVMLSSDDESDDDLIDLERQSIQKKDSDIEIVEGPKSRLNRESLSPIRKSNQSMNDKFDSEMMVSPQTSSTNLCSPNISILSNDNHSYNLSSPNETDRNTSSSSCTSQSRRNKSQVSPKRRSFTPSEAKKEQKKLKTRNKKNIRKKKASGPANKFLLVDDEDRDMIIETREKKMIFEKEKHQDMKVWEEKKITIEVERLGMEKDTMKLKYDTMKTQNSLEKSRIVLLRLEMYKERELIKKNNPDVTDEYLDKMFPFPE